MLYNKNKVRKVNDKKVLHKKGKHWITVSLGLLAAVGGGAFAANAATNANADTVNNASSQPQTSQILSTKVSSTTQAASQGNADAQSDAQDTAKVQSNINENNILNTKVAPANTGHSVSTKASPVLHASTPEVHTSANQASHVQAGNGDIHETTGSNHTVNNRTANSAQSGNVSGAKTGSALRTQSGQSQSAQGHNLSQSAASLGHSIKKFNLSSATKNSGSQIAKSAVSNKSNKSMASNVASSSAARQSVRYTSLNSRLNASSSMNIHFGNNGDLNVDGNNVTAVPDNDQDNNNYQAFDNTDLDTDKAVVTGNNGNHKGNTKDPYESNPYNPVLTFSFVNTDAGNMPVGQDRHVQAHAGEQFSINNNGIQINGNTIQMPKGYTVDPLGNDDTYTLGSYTVMPRMNVDGSWDAEDYTIGVKSSSAKRGFGAEQQSVRPQRKMMLGTTNTGAGANNNNVPNGAGNGGASNNNLEPNGPIFNNSGSNNDSAVAALINNESRDAQNTMNRMETSAEAAESSEASDASASASNSAAAVSLAESGQNQATVQNMQNSAEVQSIANSADANSAETSLHNADQASMNSFEGSVNSERATINSDDMGALNSLASMTNLTSDEYNRAMYGMQSAESTYLDQLSHASNAAEWNTITADYLSNLKGIVNDAANANGGNRSINADNIFDLINDDSTITDSMLASDNNISSDQKSSLTSGFASDASNATSMAHLNANNSSALTSIANSLNSDMNSLKAAASLSGTSDSNMANASLASIASSADANINSKRNSDINSVNNNPDLTSSEKAQINSEINSAANALLTDANNAAPSTDDLADDKRNATNDLNGDEINDRNYVNGNPSLNSAQQTSMDNQLAGMAESGVNAIDQANDNPDVQMALANAQNAMAKYSGNWSDLNGFDNSNYDPYAYDNGTNPYGTGVTHYDPTEWANETQLANAYAKYLGEGYPLLKLTQLNNEAFHYGLVDAANSLESYPALTKYAPYRDGYTSYALGFHDGEFNEPEANLANYGELYQKSYQEAYTNGQNYRNSNHKMIDTSFKNGYKASRKSMLAVGNLEGHSKQYIQGYVQGLNDRLKGHHDHLLVSRSIMLHKAPEFLKGNTLTKFYGGNRRSAAELVVDGASVDEYGHVRYHVISAGTVNHKSHHIDGWVTANPKFVKDVYYRAANAKTRGNVVHVLTNLQVHSTMNSVGSARHVVKVVHAGRNLKIRGIVRDGDITRFYIAPGEYITTNKGFVQWLH